MHGRGTGQRSALCRCTPATYAAVLQSARAARSARQHRGTDSCLPAATRGGSEPYASGFALCVASGARPPLGCRPYRALGAAGPSAGGVLPGAPLALAAGAKVELAPRVPPSRGDAEGGGLQ